jgi:aerobic carbon-monoxide dehydrogenase medium subunit
MIAAELTYRSVASLEEAVKLLAALPDGKVIAGGHSLIPLLKLGLAAPSGLVDIGRIAELRMIRPGRDGITIGAITTHQQIADDASVRRSFTALAEAAAEVGDMQVRGRGTIGGSLAHADPSADEPAAVLAFDATIRAVGPKGEREIAVRDLFVGALETALRRDEILADLHLPSLPDRTGSAYEKFPHPASRFAVVGVAAVVTLKQDGTVERAAVAVTGAADTAYRATSCEKALVGTTGDRAAAEVAAGKAAEGKQILSDLAASAEYRAHLVAVLARRAIERAVERARA